MVFGKKVNIPNIIRFGEHRMKLLKLNVISGVTLYTSYEVWIGVFYMVRSIGYEPYRSIAKNLMIMSNEMEYTK